MNDKVPVDMEAEWKNKIFIPIHGGDDGIEELGRTTEDIGERIMAIRLPKVEATREIKMIAVGPYVIKTPTVPTPAASPLCETYSVPMITTDESLFGEYDSYMLESNDMAPLKLEIVMEEPEDSDGPEAWAHTPEWGRQRVIIAIEDFDALIQVFMIQALFEALDAYIKPRQRDFRHQSYITHFKLS